MSKVIDEEIAKFEEVLYDKKWQEFKEDKVRFDEHAQILDTKYLVDFIKLLGRILPIIKKELKNLNARVTALEEGNAPSQK